MMIIRTNITKSFWNKIQKLCCLLYFRKQLGILAIGTLLISCNFQTELSVHSIKTPSGWGYIISENDKIIIKQSIIPAIQNNSSFKTEEDALKVGNFVLKKLKNNLSPSLNKNDLILLSIKI